MSGILDQTKHFLGYRCWSWTEKHKFCVCWKAQAKPHWAFFMKLYYAVELGCNYKTLVACQNQCLSLCNRKTHKLLQIHSSWMPHHLSLSKDSKAIASQQEFKTLCFVWHHVTLNSKEKKMLSTVYNLKFLFPDFCRLIGKCLCLTV